MYGPVVLLDVVENIISDRYIIKFYKLQATRDNFACESDTDSVVRYITVEVLLLYNYVDTFIYAVQSIVFSFISQSGRIHKLHLIRFVQKLDTKAASSSIRTSEIQEYIDVCIQRGRGVCKERLYIQVRTILYCLSSKNFVAIIRCGILRFYSFFEIYFKVQRMRIKYLFQLRRSFFYLVIICFTIRPNREQFRRDDGELESTLAKLSFVFVRRWQCVQLS